jgi:hypothetical protein
MLSLPLLSSCTDQSTGTDKSTDKNIGGTTNKMLTGNNNTGTEITELRTDHYTGTGTDKKKLLSDLCQRIRRSDTQMKVCRLNSFSLDDFFVQQIALAIKKNLF